jgi:hypothetical protein
MTIKMRILVEGSRGKSGIVKLIVDLLENRNYSVVGKITGKETAIFYQGKKRFMQRTKGKFLIDKENKKVLKEYNCEYKIFENQALSSYTMKAVHLLIKPDILLIPNIRFEHQDQLGETLKEQAESFAVNFKNIKLIITTETKKEVLKIFEKYAKKYKSKLIVVNKKETIPGISALHLIEKLFKLIFNGLSNEEKEKIKKEIKNRMRVKYNKDKQIYYFLGSKINDIESSTNTLNYLKKIYLDNFLLVCYFRKDRPERTKAFIPLFRKLIKDRRIKKIYISGYNLNSLPKHKKMHKFNSQSANIIFKECKEKKLILFTAINGANEFMFNFELNLENFERR